MASIKSHLVTRTLTEMGGQTPTNQDTNLHHVILKFTNSDSLYLFVAQTSKNTTIFHAC